MTADCRLILNSGRIEHSPTWFAPESRWSSFRFLLQTYFSKTTDHWLTHFRNRPKVLRKFEMMSVWKARRGKDWSAQHFWRANCQFCKWQDRKSEKEKIHPYYNWSHRFLRLRRHPIFEGAFEKLYPWMSCQKTGGKGTLLEAEQIFHPIFRWNRLSLILFHQNQWLPILDLKKLLIKKL